MNNLKLSIIIPVYNVEKYVEKCVRSCENQDIPKEDYEVIVVNDGSPDGSLAIVERLAEEYSNIKVISQENGGLSAARNTGMRNATGDYYMFVDSDDWIAENCLNSMVGKLRDEEPDALAICAANIINGVPQRRRSYPDTTPIAGRDLLKRGVAHCAPFSIWKAEFLRSHNLTFYEGIFHEDAEFTPRAYYLAKKVSFIDDIIYFVYQNPTSITRSVNPKKSFDLVNVVCPHLSEFAKSVEEPYKYLFYNEVGQEMNNAMANILGASVEQKEQLNKDIAGKAYLWNDIIKSTIPKYKLEAILVRLFPKHPLRVYMMMQLFNRKRHSR